MHERGGRSVRCRYKQGGMRNVNVSRLITQITIASYRPELHGNIWRMSEEKYTKRINPPADLCVEQSHNTAIKGTEH